MGNDKGNGEESQHENENDSDLPKDALSMRAALKHCMSMFQDLVAHTDRKSTILVRLTSEITERADNLDEDREKAHAKFWKTTCESQSKRIPTIQASRLSPTEFRKKFHNANLPCLVQYDEKTGTNTPFEQLDKEWISHDRQKIHRDWFFEHIGAETLVPIRYSTSEFLDAEGRASECETRQVPLQEWIQMLVADDKKEGNPYLKDWHLVLLLQQRERDGELYTCPETFQHDLLNPFLTKFTGGDYRFCYWGPCKSRTSRHSDVMHSFSWSYNVFGTKRWTFYKNKQTNCEQFTVLQEAGQAMFVPCTWQHEVENIQETISINHNWITVANIDKTWECLLAEMKEIESELQGWGIDHNSSNFLESSESMLRGCVGLNVTSFFAMSLMRFLELLKTTAVACDGLAKGAYDSDELQFDCYRLLLIIESLMKNNSIQLEKRIESVVMSKELAKQAVEIALTALDFVDVCTKR